MKELLRWLCLHSPGEPHLQPLGGMHDQAARQAGSPCSQAAVWACDSSFSHVLLTKAIRLQNQPC